MKELYEDMRSLYQFVSDIESGKAEGTRDELEDQSKQRLDQIEKNVEKLIDLSGYK